MSYDEIEYWNQRKRPNSATNKTTERHISFIREHTRDCETILDWGPGVGRTFSAYNSDQSIIGYDITDRYSEKVKDGARSLGLDYTHIVGKDIAKVPFSTKKFDVVVSSEVLLHQRDIEPIAEEMKRVASKIVIISAVAGITPHCFNYDYDKYFPNAEMLIHGL